MAISIVNKKYFTRNFPTGTDFLKANNGQIITDSIDIVLDFNFTSSSSNQVMINSENQLKLLSTDWSFLGVLAGDIHVFTGTISDGTNTVTFGATTYTVQSVSGDIITYTSSPFPTWSVSQIMPSITSTVFSIVSNRVQPETIEVFHNLIENASSGGDASLFDGEVNRFKATGINSMAVSDVVDMTQLGNKSGGSYISAKITRITHLTFKVIYNIEFVYIPISFEDSDFLMPYWYDSSDTLKPYYRILALPQESNPNSALQAVYSDYLGNVGWYLENYNQGINDFSIENILLSNDNGDTVSDILYNSTTTVYVRIIGSEDFSEIAEISFNIIPQLSEVQNKLSRNADLTSLSVSLSNAPVHPVAIRNSFGYLNRKMEIDSEAVDIDTNAVDISFQLTPSAEFTSYIESINSENRKYRLAVVVQSTSGTSLSNNAVAIPLKEGILLKDVISGGVYPTSFAGFLDHSEELMTGILKRKYNGCTEDDFLYHSRFNLNKEDGWKSLKVAVEVLNVSNGSSFDLISQIIPFSAYVTTIDGVIQINFESTTQQFLEAPSRNLLSLKLTGTETIDDYELELIWSLMANWRDWIAQSNAFIDFFDASLPNNGMSREWIRYLEILGFKINVKCTLTNSDDVEFYWKNEIDLQDYDDSPDATSVIEFFDSLGNNQSSLQSGENNKIVATHTLTSGSWDQPSVWGWISLRPKQGEQNKRISTVWNWSSISYPLKPLPGEVKAKLSFPTPDVAVVECDVDTSMINVNDVSVISRIESIDRTECISPIDWIFSEMIANSPTESSYYSVLSGILDGTDVSDQNICCPECVMKIDDQPMYVYAFGSSSDINSLISTFDSPTPCCRDEYGNGGNCEENYDEIIDSFLVDISASPGAVTAVLSIYPTQINQDDNMGIISILDNIINCTTDNSIRFELLFLLVSRGFKIICEVESKTIISL